VTITPRAIDTRAKVTRQKPAAITPLGLCTRVFVFALSASLGSFGPASGQEARVTEVRSFLPTRHHVGRMTFSADGKLFALPKAAEGCVEVWEIATGTVKRLESPFAKDRVRAFDAAFSTDGRLLATSYDPGGIAVFNLSRQVEQTQFPVQDPNLVAAFAFSGATPKLVMVMARVTTADKTHDLWNYSSVRWDVSTRKTEETRIYDPRLLFKALSPDGRYILLQNEGGQTVFDTEKGNRIFAIDSDGGFCFSADGSMLVSYDGKVVTLWAVPSGKELRRYQFDSSRLPRGYRFTDRFSISPNKRVLAIGGFTRINLVALVSLESGKVLDTVECGPPLMFCCAICFSPDGRILATDTLEVDRNDQSVEPLLKFWRIPDAW
jgi:WD40 repeat protein